MNAFPQPLTSIAAPMNPDCLADNVDTDAIIPSREMRSTGRDGLADGLFAARRYRDPDTREKNPDFVLNQAPYRCAKVLVAGANFGCGSSREHAVWALREWGITAIIAQSFAPIFEANCLRNFLLPIALPRETLESLKGQEVCIDLEAQLVMCGDKTFEFRIEAQSKQMLAQGLDAVNLTLKHKDQISVWIASDRTQRPWVYLEERV